MIWRLEAVSLVVCAVSLAASTVYPLLALPAIAIMTYWAVQLYVVLLELWMEKRDDR